MILDVSYSLSMSDFRDNKYFDLFANNDYFKILNSNHIGDIALRGRFKGSVINTNYILITSKSKNSFEEFVIFLEQLSQVKICNNCYTSLNLDIEYDSQCNYDLDKKTIRLLNKLELPLNISCYN